MASSTSSGSLAFFTVFAFTSTKPSTTDQKWREYQWFKKDNAKAASDYTEALRLDPSLEMVHYRRGQAYQAIKQYGKAERDFTVALQRDPEYPNLLASWAWQLATCTDAKYRDAAKALKFATKAAEGNGIPKHIDVLAAAYAENGKFEDAVATQKKALEAPGEKDALLKKAMQARLVLYQKKVPFRDK